MHQLIIFREPECIHFVHNIHCYNSEPDYFSILRPNVEDIITHDVVFGTHVTHGASFGMQHLKLGLSKSWLREFGKK